jgi:hypothetical protein
LFTVIVTTLFTVIMGLSSRTTLDGGPLEEKIALIALVPGQEYKVLFRNEMNGVTLVEGGGKQHLLTLRVAPPDKFTVDREKKLIAK